MKINLLMDNPKDIYLEYVNIDPFASGEDSRTRDNLRELTQVDDGEVEEILASNIIDYFKLEDIHTILSNWIRKLKHGGSIVLTFSDIYYFSKSILNRSLTLEEINRLLHGSQDKPYRVRKSTVSMEYVSQFLEANGLKILNKCYRNGKAMVRARRP